MRINRVLIIRGEYEYVSRNIDFDYENFKKGMNRPGVTMWEEKGLKFLRVDEDVMIKGGFKGILLKGGWMKSKRR